MSIEDNKLKNILEAALMSIARPMTIEQMMKLFDDDERPSANRVKDGLQLLQGECEGRGIELKEIASGYRYQARQDYSEWLSRLWEEKPSKYSRAYLETLALIAYRQPVTRAEIEDVRGVSVSSNIVRTMLEREWIRVVGHRDVPGRPSLYATTKQFLDYFNMKSLDELPSLAEIRDLEELSPELGLTEPGQEIAESDDSEIDAPESEVAEYIEGKDFEEEALDIADAEASTLVEERVEVEEASESLENTQPYDDVGKTENSEGSKVGQKQDDSSSETQTDDLGEGSMGVGDPTEAGGLAKGES